MPIKTKMKKSGRKRVYDQNNEGVRGGLNQAAREVFQGRHREITRGPAGLRDPLLREQSSQSQEIVQHQRRKRPLASVRRRNARVSHKQSKRLLGKS